MWQRLERKISFLNCLFVYLFFFFFLLSAFLVFFFLLTFFALRVFFFHPHFSIRIFPSASAIRRYPVRVLQTPETQWFEFYLAPLLSGRALPRHNVWHSFSVDRICIDSRSDLLYSHCNVIFFMKIHSSPYFVGRIAMARNKCLNRLLKNSHICNKIIKPYAT